MGYFPKKWELSQFLGHPFFFLIIGYYNCSFPREKKIKYCLSLVCGPNPSSQVP